ncbi:unnamed protein product [Medioppia subpectinata]|uniref:Protein kinase domain-containing protein n=1 Tax=Medioppia subpectinata TaxID=1979941 RepID=A0A7R9KRF4_9ACAR|nr:unnamed protein product [Medioppia subpectinata]CAG2108432.1 unnamed protein product [Medioppia subpectinata]
MMINIMDKFGQLKSLTTNLGHELKLFYVFDDYLGKNYIYLTRDDQCYAFGSNHCGCLGLGHNREVEEPQHVPQLSHLGVIEFYRGCDFMFARTIQNAYYCWGANECGQLGLGLVGLAGDYYSPTRNEYLSAEGVVYLCCGYKHVLALSESGQVYGWGDNGRGQVGTGVAGNIVHIPTKITMGDKDHIVKTIATGEHHSVALTKNNLVYVWGANEHGQLGTGNYTDYTKPGAIDTMDYNVVKMICNKNSTYYLTQQGHIYYCGQRYVDGRTDSVPTLTTLDTDNNVPLLPVHMLSVIRLFHLFDDKNGNKNLIYITNDDTAYGLGANTDGILGLEPTGAPIEEPLIIHSLSGKSITNFYTGQGFMMAMTKQHRVLVWGDNRKGQLGLGHESQYQKPCINDTLTELGVQELSCGRDHTLAVTVDGQLYGWGGNEWGQVGVDVNDPHISQPTRVPLHIRIKSVSAGADHTMALTTGASVYYWGRNNYGQLGHYGCRGEYGPNSILMSNVRTVVCAGNNSYVFTNYGELNVYGELVCQHHLSKSQASFPVPGNAKYVELEPVTSTGMVLARFDDCVHEIKPNEVELEELGKVSYRNYLAHEYGVTSRAIHLKAYDMIKSLGTGTFGPVFKCRNRQTGYEYTVKRFKCPGLSADKRDQLETALNQIKNTRNIYLAPVENYWIEKSKYLYIEMQYYEKTMLDIMIDKPHAFGRRFGQSMSTVEMYITCDLFAQLLEGVDYLHSLQTPVVHRNLKTTNIFVTESCADGSFIKIADFGYEKFDKLGVKPVVDHTFDGLLSKYTALEVIKGRKYGQNADVYSLGIIGDEWFEVNSTW